MRMHSLVQQARVEEAEFRLLRDGLRHCYGFDFDGYERSWSEPRIWDRVRAESVSTISGLQEKVLHDEESLHALLLALAIPSGGFFTQPETYESFREYVLPTLRTYPSIAVWYPACGSGEAVYTLAIVLHEAGLYHRCRIYATDLHEAVYRRGKDGEYPLAELEAADVRYRQAGGHGRLSDYYIRKDDRAVMAAPLRANIAFLEHQLSTDGVFREFQLIVAGHVWPAFGPGLQARARYLFRDSLDRCGLLAAESAAVPAGLPDEQGYEALDPAGRFYRKIPTGRH